LDQITAGSPSTAIPKRDLAVWCAKPAVVRKNQKHYPERFLVSQSPHHFHAKVLGAADPLIAVR
jgi:hypothetical protein